MKTTITVIKSTIKNGKQKQTSKKHGTYDTPEEASIEVAALREKRTPHFQVTTTAAVKTYLLENKNYGITTRTIKEPKSTPTQPLN